MRELTISEMEIINGGADWDEVGVGLAAASLGIALVATPVSAGVAVVAAGLVVFGGFAIGDGLVEGHAFGGDDGDS